jgi:hypothetical protein
VLRGRSGRDVTGSYPEVAASLALATGRRTMILDAVICAAQRLSDYCPPDKLPAVEDITNPIGPLQGRSNCGLGSAKHPL